MNLRLLPSVVLLAFSVVAHADDTFRRTLPVSSRPDLYVSTGTGNVHIRAGDGSQIEVTGHVHAGWSAFGDVRARVGRIVDNPPIQQSGNTVRVGEVNDRSLFNNISIDYEIKVPTDVALNLRSGSGDLEVDDAGRFLAAATGSGNVRGHGIHGNAELESGSGDIDLGIDGGGSVKAKTGSGDIHIHGLNGTFWARTGSGDVEVDGLLAGPSTITTGSGDVRLRLASESHFNLEGSTGSGDIRVHFPGVTTTNVESSRHHITMPIHGGGEALEIRTGSGDIEITPR